MADRRSTRRVSRTALAAVVAAFVLSGCGNEPLQGIGQRTGEWIGPLAEEVAILPGG